MTIRLSWWISVFAVLLLGSAAMSASKGDPLHVIATEEVTGPHEVVTEGVSATPGITSMTYRRGFRISQHNPQHRAGVSSKAAGASDRLPGPDRPQAHRAPLARFAQCLRQP
jgi:hypothetical protein